MVQSNAKSVKGYLDELPEERREVVAAVREVVLRNLPAGYREEMNWGMITWSIPLESYPETYNGQPLCYAALAAQKNYYSLYLMSVYQASVQEGALREAFRKAGKKLDIGKCCIRFRSLDDLSLEAVGREVGSMPVDEYIARYEASRQGMKSRKPARKK